MEKLKAHQIMSFPVTCSLSGTSLYDILKKLFDRGFTVMPIVNSGRNVLGTISKKCILQLIFRGESIKTLTAAHIINKNMANSVVTADVNSSAGAILKALVLEDLEGVPITDGNKLVGVVTMHDFLKREVDSTTSGFLSVSKKESNVSGDADHSFIR